MALCMNVFLLEICKGGRRSPAVACWDSDHWVATVKREMLVAIIFSGFENITIWLRFNLAISLKESGWGPYFVQLVTTNFGEIYYFANFAK